MQRIVDGIAYEGKTVLDAFDVRVWECSGHREISARPVVEWTEIGPAPDWSHLLEPDPERDAKIEEDRRQKNLLRAARRAKTQCRRFIKSNGFDELATLTYRENQTDEKLAKAHFAKWARRMAELVPGFGYCVGYERQKRGAWHMHAAIYRLPAKIEVPFRMADGSWLRREVEAWKLGTIVWRRIVGKDGGMCFIGGKGEGAKKARNSLAKMAAYVSKYITKHFEDSPEDSRRWTHSAGTMPPKPVLERFAQLSMRELIERVFWCDDGERVVDHRIGVFRDSYYLCTELQNRSEIEVDITGIVSTAFDALPIV